MYVTTNNNIQNTTIDLQRPDFSTLPTDVLVDIVDKVAKQRSSKSTMKDLYALAQTNRTMRNVVLGGQCVHAPNNKLNPDRYSEDARKLCVQQRMMDLLFKKLTQPNMTAAENAEIQWQFDALRLDTPALSEELTQELSCKVCQYAEKMIIAGHIEAAIKMLSDVPVNILSNEQLVNSINYIDMPILKRYCDITHTNFNLDNACQTLITERKLDSIKVLRSMNVRFDTSVIESLRTDILDDQTHEDATNLYYI